LINRLLPLKKNNNSAAGAKEVERWTAKVKYGSRLVAETDCILFYQKDIWRYVSARKFPNMVNEMVLKSSLYNMFIVMKEPITSYTSGTSG
jgi:hypothetical protein